MAASQKRKEEKDKYKRRMGKKEEKGKSEEKKSKSEEHLIVVLLLDSCIVELVAEHLITSSQTVIFCAICSLTVKITWNSKTIHEQEMKIILRSMMFCLLRNTDWTWGWQSMMYMCAVCIQYSSPGSILDQNGRELFRAVLQRKVFSRSWEQITFGFGSSERRTAIIWFAFIQHITNLILLWIKLIKISIFKVLQGAPTSSISMDFLFWLFCCKCHISWGSDLVMCPQTSKADNTQGN